MGKRHNTLDYKYFHKTKYIKELETKCNIDNFKKEYKKEFDMIYDIFKTLIVVNNIIFSDSNKSISDKIFDLQIELEKCLYGDNDNDSDKRKYSIREINSLHSIEPKRIYNNFIEWYDYLSGIEKLGSIPNEVEKIIQELDNYGFDNIVNENIIYKENKNSNQRLYLSKFFKYNCDEEYLNKYLDNYYKQYIEELPREEIKQEICFIFDLVAKANNGIMRKLNNIQDTFTKKNFENYDYIYDYFDTLNIKILDNDKYITLKEEYTKEETQIYFFLSLYDIENFSSEEIESPIDITKNFDLYSFVVCMYQIINNILEIKTKNQMLLKIIADLKSIYNNVLNNNYEIAQKKALDIIDNNKDVFIKIS